MPVISLAGGMIWVFCQPRHSSFGKFTVMGSVCHLLRKQWDGCWHKSAFYLPSITVALYRATDGTARHDVQGFPRSSLPTCVP